MLAGNLDSRAVKYVQARVSRYYYYHFFQFGTGGNAQEGQACSKCAHLSHTREPIRIKWGRTLYVTSIQGISRKLASCTLTILKIQRFLERYR